MKKLLAVLILSLIALSPLFSISAGAIYYASDSDLISMCQIRGIDSGGMSREEMQNALYQAEGLEAYTADGDAVTGGDATLSVNNAESLTTENGRVIISGNASITFRDGNGVVSELSADSIIIDTNTGHLAAIDNVVYHSDSENASIQDISADIISVFWDSGQIKVSNAVTATEQDTGDEPVTFFTSGETLTYMPGGSILYENGRVGSAAEDPYSSITAATIAMLPGQDMMISNAYLSIGRVPIFWVPYFFFPGSRVTGNPTFGMTSTRGSFINTTFEVLGTSDRISSSDSSGSFMSMVSSSSSGGDLQPYGSYYSDRYPLTPAQQWARDTSSYVAIMADAYSELGLHVGIDSKINLFSNTLRFDIFSGIALSSPDESSVDRRFRYYGVNSITYQDYGLTAEILLPFYSDNQVLREFGNRLSGFSIFHVISPPSFPTTYTSSISSYTTELNLSYTLPSQYRNTYVQSFSITDINVGADWRWSSSENRYYVEGTTLPGFNMSLSGALFEFSGTAQGAMVLQEEEETDVTDVHVIDDPLLYSVYKHQRRQQAIASGNAYDISLKYSISESFDNTYDYDIDGNTTDSRLSSSTAARLTFNADMADYIEFDAVFTPSYSYIHETENLGATIITQNASVSSTINLAVPIIGLTYSISTRLYNMRSVDSSIDTDDSLTILNPGWDTDTVTAHAIGFRRAFDTVAGTFTPALTYRLPPLTGQLVPSFSYSYGPFAATFSWTILQDEGNDQWLSDLVELSLGYEGTYVTSSIALKYQSSEYDPSDFFMPLYGTASLSLRTADKRWSITQFVDYEYSNGSYRNYFNSIKTTLNIPYFELSLDWRGPADAIRFGGIEADIDIDSVSFQLWKGRIYFAFGLEASFVMDMDNPYAASFEITPSITFSIAEFIDITFSFTSQNNGFYEYFIDGVFSWSEMFKDLGQSFDFFGGGRYETNFVIDSCALEITHYMADWDLSVRYEAQIQLIGDNYQFVPELSIYLSWKTIPDIKIDQTWRERNGSWSMQ